MRKATRDPQSWSRPARTDEAFRVIGESSDCLTAALGKTICSLNVQNLKTTNRVAARGFAQMQSKRKQTLVCGRVKKAELKFLCVSARYTTTEALLLFLVCKQQTCIWANIWSGEEQTVTEPQPIKLLLSALWIPFISKAELHNRKEL